MVDPGCKFHRIAQRSGALVNKDLLEPLPAGQSVSIILYAIFILSVYALFLVVDLCFDSTSLELVPRSL